MRNFESKSRTLPEHRQARIERARKNVIRKVTAAFLQFRLDNPQYHFADAAREFQQRTKEILSGAE